MHPRRYLTLFLLAAAFGSAQAMASDIQCATTQQPAERVICDHAILNNEYEDIFAQQQALLNAGKLSAAQLAQWRQSRNACSDVHCIDVAFAQWTAMAKATDTVSQAAQAPAVASSTDFAPVGPAPDAVPPVTPPAVPTSEASLVRQGSAAGVALPQPVTTLASSPAVASAVSSPGDSRSATGMSAGLIVALLVVIVGGVGVLFQLRRRRGGGAADTPENRRGKEPR